MRFAFQPAAAPVASAHQSVSDAGAQQPQASVRPPADGVCPSCGSPVHERFCPRCGERRRPGDALSLRHLARETVEQASSLDVTLLRTLATLVRRPGALTDAYVRGARGRYTRPVQLFLLLNVVFFLVAPRLGLLEYRRSAPFSAVELGDSMRGRMLARHQREHRLSPSELRDRFNASVERRRREAFSLWVLAFAGGVALLHLRGRRYLAEHLVFAIHFFTFVLLFAPAVVAAAHAGGGLLASVAPRVGPVLPILLLVGLAGGLGAYLAVALRRVYGGPWWWAGTRAALLLTGMASFGLPYHRIVTYLAIVLM